MAAKPRRVTAKPKQPPKPEEPTVALTVVETGNPDGVEHTVEVYVPPEEREKDWSRTLTVPLSRASQYEDQLSAFQQRARKAERMIAEGTAELEAAYREFAAQTTWIGEQIRAEEKAEHELYEAQQEAEWAAEVAEMDAHDAKLDKKYGPALWVYLPKATRSRSTRYGETLHAWWMVHTATCQHAKKYRDSRPVASGEKLTSPDHWEYGNLTVYGRARADMIAKVMKTPKVEWCGSCKPLDLLNEKVPNWRNKEWK